MSAVRLLLIATWTLIHILIMFRYVLSYSLRFSLLLDVLLLNKLNLSLKYMLWRDIWSDKCINAELDSITNIAWWLQLSYYLWLKLTQWRRAKTSLCCVGSWYDYFFFIIVIVILNSSFSWSMFSPFGRHPFIQQFFSALHSSLIDSKLLKTLIYLWWINMKYNWRKKMISLWQPDSIKEFWLWTDPTHTIIAKIKNDVLIIAQKRSDKQEKVDASGSTLFSVHRCFQPFHDDARVTLRPFRSLENIKTQFVCVRRHRKVTTSSWSIRFPSSYVESR